MKIALGSDHHGVETRRRLVELLTEAGHTAVDMGTCSTEPADYPDIAQLVAQAVARGEVDRGVLICGSGIGMSIAANKVDGVRAAPCYDEYSTTLCRRHNNANILCLSDDMVGRPRNLRLVQTFLATDFEGGRHEKRVAKIAAIEKL